MKGFNKLRKATVLGTIGSMSLLGIGTGRAAPTTLDISITVSSAVEAGTSVIWESVDNSTVETSDVFPNTTSATSTDVSAFGIDDASLNNISHSWSGSNYTGSTSSGSSSSDDLNDAFDDYGGLFLDGTPYNDPDGIVDLTGGTVTTDPQTMPNGIVVSAQLHAFTDKRTMRIIYILNNPTAGSISASAVIGGDMGSDSRTYVAATSNSNQTVETGDTWVVTHDRNVYGGVATSDPILTHIVAGANSELTPVPLEIPGNGVSVQNDDISFVYNLTVQPGETQYITWFVQMSASMSEATASLPDYADFDSATAAGLFVNLPTSLPASAVNWGAPAPSQLGPPKAIPALSPAGLLGLGGLLGLLTFRRLRKQKV